MTKSIKTFLTTIAAAGALLFPALVPAVASAGPSVQQGLCGGVELQSTPAACAAGPDQDSSINNVITTVINVFSVIVGFISVVMIIYGGFKYITSGGDSGKVTAAKNTILYALIGLVVVALAQLIVRFVIAKATTDIA